MYKTKKTQAEENFYTIALKYTTTPQDYIQIKQDMKEYTNLVKFSFNRIYDVYPEKITQSQMNILQKALNNITLDSHFRNCAFQEAQSYIALAVHNLKEENEQRQKNKLPLKTKINSRCFGGKKLYTDYQKGLITKEELDVKRLLPVYSRGEACKGGNRKFELQKDKIIYKKCKNCHIELNIPFYANYEEDYLKLIKYQNAGLIPITIKLDLEYVYVIYDLNKLKKLYSYKPIRNRVLGIDQNPNHLGWTVVEWYNETNYKIIAAGEFSLEELNKYDNSLKGKGLSTESKERKYITNKRHYDVSIISKRLVNLAKHYLCEIVAIEDLTIEHEDLGRGWWYNKTCNNQWCRSRMIKQIERRSKLEKVKFIKIAPDYSSFIGNLVYLEEKLPDYCLAAIEISRRGYEYNLQYLEKIKKEQKNIRMPKEDQVKRRVVHALEVLDYTDSFDSLRSLYYSLKKSNVKYRFPLEEKMILKSFKSCSRRSFMKSYIFKVSKDLKSFINL